jgi:hypothetical protein
MIITLKPGKKMNTHDSFAVTICSCKIASHLRSACPVRLLPLLLLLTLPAVLQAQFTFTTNNGVITITKYTGPGGDVIIPATTNGYPVTIIAGAKGAFSDSGVTSVTIPDSITNLGSFAFSHCTKLTSITVPDRVGYVGDQAFGFCTSLTNAVLGSNVMSVGNYVFRACTNLPAISVNELNPKFSSLDGVFFNKSRTVLVECPAGKGNRYTVPHAVTNIGNYAFSTCARLTEIVIPDSVTTIGNYAFSECAQLTGITLPDSVTSIGESAFYSCTGLVEITLANSVTNIGSWAFSACTSLRNITIPDSIKRLESYMFASCVNLTNVTFGSGVANIGYSAFDNCTSLTNITLPANMTSIVGSFANSRLISITIPASVTNIGFAAFERSSLTSIMIPNSVTSIGDFAFSECSSLKQLLFEGNAPGIGANVFYNDYFATIFYLPGTTNWTSTFGGRPTVLWNPMIQTGGSSFGIRTNRFGFNITGTTNIPIVVDACTSLANPAWIPLQSCNLTNGSLYFSDPDWTNYPARLYRVRWP